MEGAKLDKFFPLDLTWIARASVDWDSKDVGPILLVVFYLWPKGGRAPADMKKLSNVARVSPRAWQAILARTGTFFREEAGDLVQDFLVALYAEKLKAFLSNQEKAKAAIAARWEKKGNRSPSTSPGNTPSIPSGTTPGNTPSITPSSTSGSVRADLSYSDLKNSEREEGSIATAVPSATVDEEIAAALRAYPKTRKIPGGGTTEVRIGTNATDQARAFLAANPGYPLHLAARYTAKRDQFPKDWVNWLEDPPDAALVREAYQAHLKAKQQAQSAAAPGEPIGPSEEERLRAAAILAGNFNPPSDPESLRALVGAINSHAEGAATHA